MPTIVAARGKLSDMHFWDSSQIAMRLQAITQLYRDWGVSGRDLSLASGMPETYLDVIPGRLTGGSHVSFLFFVGLHEATGVNLNWLATGNGSRGIDFTDKNVEAIKQRAKEIRAANAVRAKQKKKSGKLRTFSAND